MKKVLDIVLWSTASFLLIPSGLILVSWNALPSQPMYRVKVGLEKTLLAVLPSSVLQSSMQVKFTERRFDEAEQLLATNLASTGLNNLDQQVLETQRSIQYLDNPVDQAKAADQYIQTLRKVSTKLAQKQQIIASRQGPIGQTTPGQEQQYQTGETTTVVNNYYYYPAPTAPQQQTQGAPTSQPGLKSPGQTSQPAAAAARPTQTSAPAPTYTPTSATTQPPAPSTTSESDLSAQVSNTQQQIENTIREMERIRQNAQEAKKKQEEKKEDKKEEKESKKEEKNEEND